MTACDRTVPCAGAIVVDGGRLLLIRRGTEPGRGLWSVPGGRCEAGEDAPTACVRETAEETGLVVRVLQRAGSVRRDGPGGVVYAIDDYLCELVRGTLRAGDDAADAAWFDRSALDALPVVPGLRECLREWQVLDRLG